MTNRPGAVFYLSLLILIGFVAVGALRPDQLASVASEALGFTTDHFGWLYLFVTTGFLLFCCLLYTSPSPRD